MKTTISFALFGLYAMAGNVLAVEHDLELEPCINGDVSSSGRYASQQAEDIRDNASVVQSEE